MSDLTKKSLKSFSDKNNGLIDFENINDTNEEIFENKTESNLFLQLCDSLIDDINKTAKKHKNTIRYIKKLYKKNVSTKDKTDARPKKKIKKKGFVVKERVPDKLADYLGIKQGIELPRTKVTKKFYEKLKDKNLFYEKSKRVFRVDKEICDLFGIPESVNQITDERDKNGFNFFNLQKYISKCYLGSKPQNNIANP